MIRRRELLGVLGGAAALPVAARAQQSAIPVVGLINSGFPETSSHRVAAFRQGLSELGYVEGQNVIVEYRWAEGHYNRYPEFVTDLIRRKVNVIATGASTPATLAAKAATSTIPIVFGAGEDPVKVGLVASLARPGGNLTGVNFFTAEVAAKRLGLLLEMFPKTKRLAVLVNPENASTAESTIRDVQAAAPAHGLNIQVFKATTIREIDSAYAALMREQPDALLVGGDGFINSRRVQLALLGVRHSLPAMYAVRDYPEAGGLMSYGTSFSDTFKQIGLYCARILKGSKPSDLPVLQSTKFELVINMQAARMLGLEVPPMLLARTDEVIE